MQDINYKLLDLFGSLLDKKITLKDIEDKNFSYEDYRNLLYTLQGNGNDAYYGVYFRLPSSIKKIYSYDKITQICSYLRQLTETAKNKLEALQLKQDLDNNLDLDMSWDDEALEKTEFITNNVNDALVLSLANKAEVDINYISQITNLDPDKVIEELKGQIFQNPEKWNDNKYEGFEIASEYLSGNMYQKLAVAKDANDNYPGHFYENIEAIKKVYPKIVDINDIYVSLGSPWIPCDIIDDFIIHILGKPLDVFSWRVAEHFTRYDKLTGTWEVKNANRYDGRNIKYYSVWGTVRYNALKVLSSALNMRKPLIYDKAYGMKADGTYGDIEVLNKEETLLAQEKQRRMINEFKNWVWTDKKRRDRLFKIYKEKYASFIQRKYDGSFLTFPNINPNIKLFDYQKNAVARILFSKNVLLAHDVGSGKTYEMAVAGMELKRIGISKKNMYVVPNNIVGQWVRLFKDIYPNANLLVVEPKNFTPKKRQDTLRLIRDTDYDGIIIAYSCFDNIPLSIEAQINMLEEEKLKILNSESSVFSYVATLDARKERINKKILELKLKKKDDSICFDDLKINRIFLDEAHNYKNVPIDTKMKHVLGINAAGSKKAQDMLQKVRIVQKHNDGAGLIMATGTPITNSVTEAYILQLYLQPGTLNILDISSFDSWAGMFGETNTEFEIDVTTNSYRMATRFSKFHNLPELTNLLSMVADFHKMDKENGLPDFDGYIDIKINKTPEFEEFLKDISYRADKVRNKKVSRKDDNMLMITTDGRKAALDLRLINEHKYSFSIYSKVAECAKNIYVEYIKGDYDKTTQLVFCDTSTPKDGFNIYDELSNILINMGIPKKEIAYIHDANSEKERLDLYDKVRQGFIRVLIGSTFKLGLGVNVQDKAKALHHLDIPWRPADMTQREGRILRQGNTNKGINIYRYVTEGSFDAYSWQLLETKQKFISDLLSGSLKQRDGEEIDEIVLSYGEIKALAIGDPLIKEKVEVTNEIQRLHLLQSKNASIRFENQQELLEIPHRIRNIEKLLDRAKEDYEYTKTLNFNTDDLTKQEKETLQLERMDIRNKIDDALNNNVLINVEREFMDYKGFKIKLPAYMTKEKPYLILQRVGTYNVEMGESLTGNLIRIDNFIEGFERVISNYQEALKNLTIKKDGLIEESNKKDDTFEQIEVLMHKLNNIDERLGLENE